MRPYQGLLTAMVTPFRADGEVNDEAAVALGRYLLQHGSDGLVVAGTTGEGATLSDEELSELVRLIAGELGSEGSVVAGAGTNDTRHAVHLTEAVIEAGAQAVLSVTPYYNKPNRRGIVRHFEEVARAADGTPVILYNIPGRTATNMPPDLLAELAQIDGIVAVKQANGDELQPIDGLAVLAGDDTLLAQTLDFGGAGGICVASHVVGPRDEAPVRRARGAGGDRRLAARRLRDAVPDGQPDLHQGGAEPDGVGGGSVPAADGRRRRGRDRGGPRDARAPRVAPAGRHGVSGTLRVLPLGGVGEIGKNMTVVEYDGKIVVVDCGLRFPTAEMMGIDLVLPDFTYLREHVEDIEAIVITHGHEDHIGALPWVLRDLGETSVPVIYGGQLTVAMGRSKLDEHRLREANLEVLPTGQKVQAGPFEIELVHLTHSIPDMVGVILRCELGTVLFTGDYKFDQTPVGGAPADVSRLAELGRDGVLLLCGDSTNADRPGTSVSESVVGPNLERVFARCQGRIVTTSFASNIHRVQQVVDAAVTLGRKVCLVGRSMRKNVNIGRTLGHIVVPEGTLIPPRELDNWPDDRVVIISTGSQGEPSERVAPHGLPRPSADRAPRGRHRRVLRHPDPWQ